MPSGSVPAVVHYRCVTAGVLVPSGSEGVTAEASGRTSVHSVFWLVPSGNVPAVVHYRWGTAGPALLRWILVSSGSAPAVVHYRWATASPEFPTLKIVFKSFLFQTKTISIPLLIIPFNCY